MDFVQAIILGIVEGITEFLPISSTGHLILTSNLLAIEQTEFVKTFEISIQSGAILSVIFLYSLPAGRQGEQLLKVDFEILKRVLVAFIPTAILGFTLYKFIKNLLGSSEVVLLSLFLGGIILIAVEILFQRGVARSGGPLTSARSPAIGGARTSGGGAERQDPEQKLSYERAFVIGLFQSVSMIPGVSRAAATIIGGMLVGLPRKTAVEFSFLLAVPTMLAATALDLTSYLPAVASAKAGELTSLAVGFITSFIVALISIKWLLKYVQRHNFIIFGIYRIAIAAIYFLLIF